tara:strand:+ start:480 stop:1652 length:1173 start_codon:yes stop_codon:yes gene_type:complete
MVGELSDSDKRRYSRHLVLPEVGIEGQLKLRDSSVCVIGAGGLGSPVLMYLAAAGVGRIGVVDDDEVDESNLQRQVIHSTSQVGISKVASAVARMEAINPAIKIEPHLTRLNTENAFDIIGGYDLVIDGTDNLPTRYLISDACEIIGLPWVYASIYRFEGHLSLFNYEGGPNYRDLFPTPPPPELVPSCAQGGVLGVLPGVIGSLQANEAIKCILGIGEPLSGILLVYDALETRFRGLQISKDPEREKVTELTDVEAFCAESKSSLGSGQIEEPSGGASETMFQEISAGDAAKRMSDGWKPFVLDVRTEREADIATISNASALIPHDTIDTALDQIPKDGDILLYCHHGRRSMMALMVLASVGIEPERLYNLSGGIDSWSLEVDESVPRY